jgi:hypothetical protein
MAKPIQQIKDEMDAALAASSLATVATNSSAMARYRAFMNVIADVIFVVYREWDTAKMQLAAITSSSIIGTANWYVTMAKAWTYNGSFLIDRASCRENGTKVFLKVAKNGGTGLVNLSQSELAEFAAYIKAKKVVGTDITCISQTADLIAIRMDIQYSGAQASIEADCKNKIKQYLASLTFDESLNKGAIADYIAENVTGVIAAYTTELKVDIGVGYTTVIGAYIAADAGYFEVGKQNGTDLITLDMHL